jgi:sec-independent protein translocase protein TatA
VLNGLLQPTHLLVIVIVALLILGPKRIPEAGRALGHGIKEFKNSIAGAQDVLQPPVKPAPVRDEEPVTR